MSRVPATPARSCLCNEWVAVSDPGDPDFARRLRKGAGADPTASGATRVAEPSELQGQVLPRTSRASISPTLRQAGSCARTSSNGCGWSHPRNSLKFLRPRVSPTYTGRRKWPSYRRCVEGAPLNHDKTRPDYSRIDFTWAMTALGWGWGIEEVAARLMVETPKARENGEQYALLTAQTPPRLLREGAARWRCSA